jgi:hypothetical protein
MFGRDSEWQSREANQRHEERRSRGRVESDREIALGGATMRIPNQDEVVNAIWRALIRGCDDGTYFDRDGDLLVVDGRLNLPIVAQDLQQRLAEINNKGKPH